MKKWLVSLVAAGAVALAAPRASAGDPTVYGSGQAGLQTKGSTGAQIGAEVGLHWLCLDAYVSYMGFGNDRSISRGIAGVRGALGEGRLRLVLRGGVGAIRESAGALTATAPASASAPTTNPETLNRTGFDLRAGAAVDFRVYDGVWLGVGADGEAYTFPSSPRVAFSRHATNVLGVLKLTLEFGF